MPRPFAGPVGRLRLGLLVVLLGAAGVGAMSLLDLWAVHRVRTGFVPATATVETLQLVPTLGSDERNRPAFAYTPYVRYRFRIGDEVYTSTRVGLWDEDLNGNAAVTDFRNRFAPGASVECFHDPDDPSDVLLVQPTAETPTARLQAVGVVVLVVVISGLLLELCARLATNRPVPRQSFAWHAEDDDRPDPLARSRRLYRDRYESR